MNVQVTPPVDITAARGAFHRVADMENPIERLSGMLRMLIVMQLDDIMPDPRDALAVLETVRIAQEALDRVQEHRTAAFRQLHPFVYSKQEAAQ